MRTKKNTLICLFFFLIGGFVSGQTTTYTENFTAMPLSSGSYLNSSFSTTISPWSRSSVGKSNTAGVGGSNCAKFQASTAGTSITTPTLRGVNSITYTVLEASAVPNNMTLSYVTDVGNASNVFNYSTATSASPATAIDLSTSNTTGIYTFTFGNTANQHNLDDIVFTFRKPTTQASALSVTFTGTGAKLDWTRPNSGNDNQGCVVFIGPSASTFVNPTNSQSYTDNLAFGSGTQIGTSGYYCVYNGANSTATVTGLTQGTSYSVYVMEYNGFKAVSDENYNTTSPASLTFTHYTGVITVSPTSLSGFDATPSSTSPFQSFTVTGSSLTGNIVVTPSTGYEISLASGSGYANSSITLTQTAGSVATTTIYVRLQTGLAVAAYSGNISIVAPNITQVLPLTGACYKYFYYKGTGSLATLSNWGVNTDGTGAAPSDFGSVTAGQIFVIKNTTNVSTDTPWTIGVPGTFTGNKLQIGDGASPAITFTITAGNPLNISNKDKVYVLAASGGRSNELIFKDTVIPTLSAPDPLTNLTYANGGSGLNVSGSLCNTLKITNNTSVTLNNSPDCKYLIVDFGSIIKASSSYVITLSPGGNAVINGTIIGARSQGIFTTDPSLISPIKGTVFSADTSATMTLGCNSTVIYNRGSAQTLSPLNYANLIISAGSATFPSFPTATPVTLSGTARIDGSFSFTGTPNGSFTIGATGVLRFGVAASISTAGGSVDFNSRPVTLESNSGPSSVNLTGVLNQSGITTANIAGTASPSSLTICYGSMTSLSLASYSGAIQWQQSPDGSSGWVNVSGGSGATTATYTTAALLTTTYYRAKVSNGSGQCSSTFSNVIVVAINLKRWNGSWLPSAPSSSSDSIEFQGDFTSSGNITGCSCTVTSGNVIISSGNSLNLTDALYVNGGSIVFNDTASLIQTNSVATNTCYDPTKVSFLRKTALIRKYDFTYWSSPVNNQQLINVSPLSSLDKFFSFNASSNNWANESSTNTMVLGKGYIIRGPDTFDAVTPSQYTATFNGIPNNGNTTIAIDGASGIFNLLGNPYPSAIDAVALYQDNNTAIKPNFYFWTHKTALTANNYSTNDYAIYNAAIPAGIGTGSPSFSGGVAPDRYIDAEQGFFVEGLGSGNLVFKNTHRISGFNNAFYKQQNTSSNSATNNVESDKFWLNLTNDLGLFKQQLICYVAGATNGFDDLYDAKDLQSNEFVQFYSLSSTNDKCAIQSRVSPFVNQDSVTLGFSTNIAGNFTISLDHFDGLFINQDIYLVDNYLGLYTNLQLQSYQFSSITGNFNDRFTIQYVLPNLLVPSNAITNTVLVYSNNNELFIKSLLDNISKVKIIDVLGRVIVNEEHIDNTTKVMTIYNKKGVVFVEITLASGVTVVKKVFF